MKNKILVSFICIIGLPFLAYAKEKSYEYSSIHSASSEGKSKESASKSVAEELSSRLSFYKPIYFALGTPDAKVQISLKYQLFKNYKLFFAFNEEIFWDIFEHSAPFSNVQYSPEVFYRFNPVDSFISVLDIGFFKHASNGKGGVDSRSLNQSSIRVLKDFHSGDVLFRWGTQVHVNYSLDENNKDIHNYRGYYTLEFSISQILTDVFYDSELKLQFRSAGASGLHPLLGNKTLTYQIRPFGDHFTPSFFVQTSYGYSESLLIYKESEFTLRGGISLFE